jgi:hypothetical protein
MACDGSVPECSSNVGDVKHDGLNRAESSSGDPPVGQPFERHYAAYTLDGVGQEETDDQCTCRPRVSRRGGRKEEAYPMCVRMNTRSS